MLNPMRIDTGIDGKPKWETAPPLPWGSGGSVLHHVQIHRRPHRVAILIECSRTPLKHIELCLAFSVQEEIGLRGAKVAAITLNP